MIKANKKKKMIHSVEEFRKIYLPEQTTKRSIETPEEARDFGISLANESMKKIKIVSLKE